MRSLEADQAFREFDIPEAAHPHVLQEASRGRPWSPEALSAPGVEIDEDVYAEGILAFDPREKQDRHDLLIDGRVERFRRNLEKGKQKWDLVLTERDFYTHPSTMESYDDLSHERQPETHLKMGDGDLIFLDLDRYEAHTVEVKPHDGYDSRGSAQDEGVREPGQGFSGVSESLGSSEQQDIYEFVTDRYPQASQGQIDTLLDWGDEKFDESLLFSVTREMPGSPWQQVVSEFRAMVEAGEIPQEYLDTSHEVYSQPEPSDSGYGNAVTKKTRNWREAWESVIDELERDWSVYEPEFVFGSDVLEGELSGNTEYALPPSYSQGDGYAMGTDEGFRKAASSDDMETLNQFFFRGGVDELVEGERPEMDGERVF
ncbi:MAG: hypothetical protein ABEK10_00690 [Candidatus Nanosalina sp.]